MNRSVPSTEPILCVAGAVLTSWKMAPLLRHGARAAICRAQYCLTEVLALS